MTNLTNTTEKLQDVKTLREARFFLGKEISKIADDRCNPQNYISRGKFTSDNNTYYVFQCKIDSSVLFGVNILTGEVKVLTLKEKK